MEVLMSRFFMMVGVVMVAAFCACSSDDSGGSSGGSCATKCPNGVDDCASVACDCPTGVINSRACNNGCCMEKEALCKATCQ